MNFSYYNAEKVFVIPEELNISKDTIWLLLNKTCAMLIVTIDQKEILFANPNASKIFENESIIGSTFSYGNISYGEPQILKVKGQIYEMRTAIITWKDEPAYLVVIEDNSFVNIKAQWNY